MAGASSSYFEDTLGNGEIKADSEMELDEEVLTMKFCYILYLMAKKR